jgi:hypothetical protein
MIADVATDLRFDVIIAADMTVAGDRAFRIALEAHHYERLGLRVALLHSRSERAGHVVAPEIAAVVRRNVASILDPRNISHGRLIVLHAPSEMTDDSIDLTAVGADKMLLVSYSARDFELDGVAHRLPRAADIRWAPISDDVRRSASKGERQSRYNWLPAVPADDLVELPAFQSRTASIGWIVSDASDLPPYDSPASMQVLAICLAFLRPDMDDENRIIDLREGHLSLRRLIGGLQGFAYFPAEGSRDIPDALIVTAIRAGRPVAMPKYLEARFGSGPIYCEASDALVLLQELINDPLRLAAFSERLRLTSAKSLRSNMPVVRGRIRRETPAAVVDKRPVMFVIGGGTGVGHVARLLAIARRMDPETPVMFVSQSPAIGAIEKLGYVAEYIPSASYVGGDRTLWEDWLEHELDLLIDDYDPSIVVFDGNHLYPGLIRAAVSRPDCKLAWVRRGLWGATYSRYMSNARWCDLIIEPGELTGQPDTGITARRRNEVVSVAPIRLLDEDELLGRAEAAKALGLDPQVPAVLVQLGVNSSRETVSLTDIVVQELQKFPKLQICIAEFDGPETQCGLWPEVTYLRGFPLSQYLRAFDFSVAAAGYNTFHEVIGFALPTVFLPNRHPSMDDQAGRATFAQNAGAAFEVDEPGLADLPEHIKLMLEPKGRQYLVEKCRMLRLPNGAHMAATLLAELAGATP